MWWHKLIKDWTKSDYGFFATYSWILIFSILIIIRLLESRTVDWVFTSIISLIMVPVELVIIAAFQKYSSNTKDISDYSAILPNDFQGARLLKDGKSLVLLYAEWCPFCRKSFGYFKSLDTSGFVVFRVNLSDENNPLWASLNIKTVPTLIAFKGGMEFWRSNGVSMVGLRKKDFKEAINALSQ